jgi:myosin light chain 6
VGTDQCSASLYPPSPGEKLTDDEVDALLTGLEDSQGQVNYEEFIKMVINA